MEHRAEPRFLVSSPIRVIVPGTPARILNCDLVDVSATGMRFISKETVTPDEIVAVEVDSRLVLAEIRYCQPRGDKFVAGVRRLHEIAKGAELTDSGACATEMIGDLRRHISAGGERDSKALAMKALEEIVGRGEVSAGVPEPTKIEVLSPEPIPPQSYAKAPATTIPSVGQPDELPHQAPVGPAPIDVVAIDVREVSATDARVEHGFARIETNAPVPAAPIDIVAIDVTNVSASAAPVGQESAETKLHQPVEAVPIYEMPVEAAIIESTVAESAATIPAEVLEGDDKDADVPEVRPASIPVEIKTQEPVVAKQEPVVAKQEPVVAKLEPVVAKPPVIELVAKAPVRAPVPIATDEVTADPLSAARSAELIARSAGKAPLGSGKSPRSWRVPLGIAAGLVLAGVGFTLMQRGTQANPSASAITVQPEKLAPTPTPAVPSVPPASVPSPDQKPVNAVAVHHAQIKMVQASWVSIIADGGKQFQTVFHKGDIHDFDFKDKAYLWLGNAAGVEVTLDNAPIGPVKGTVRLLLLTPHGVQFPTTAPPSIK